MIITVTLNPAVDKTAVLEQMNRGGLNRMSKVRSDAGGKGINVSRTIAVLGGKSIAVGFVGGAAGMLIEKQLAAEKIRTDFVKIAGETRTNLKIAELDGILTECNEAGPTVTEEEIQKLTEKLEGYAKEGVLFVLAGSLPNGVPASFYAQLIRRLKSKGAAVLLDADGEAFSYAVEENPDIIKPNIEELKRYFSGRQIEQYSNGKEVPKMLFQKEEVSESWAIRKIQWFFRQGISCGAVSMGKDGALLFRDGEIYRCPPIPVEVSSTVGAGDAMVAAMAYAWENELDTEQWLRLCMAVSAGAVTTEGTRPPSLKTVRELYEKAGWLKIL